MLLLALLLQPKLIALVSGMCSVTGASSFPACLAYLASLAASQVASQADIGASTYYLIAFIPSTIIVDPSTVSVDLIYSILMVWIPSILMILPIRGRG